MKPGQSTRAQELAIEADPSHLVVRDRLDHRHIGHRAQAGKVLARELNLLARPHLTGDVEDAAEAVLPTCRVLTHEPWRVEPVDRERDIAWFFDVEHRTHRKDVDDPAVTPVIPTQCNRLDEQGQRDGHVDRARHGHVGIGTGPEILETVLLDVPDRRVRGNR